MKSSRSCPLRLLYLAVAFNSLAKFLSPRKKKGSLAPRQHGAGEMNAPDMRQSCSAVVPALGTPNSRSSGDASKAITDRRGGRRASERAADGRAHLSPAADRLQYEDDLCFLRTAIIVNHTSGKRRAADVEEGEVSDGGASRASIASSSMSKLARKAQNGFDIR